MSGESRDHRSDRQKKPVQYSKVVVGLEELRGNVYSFGTLDQSERYVRTTKLLAEYVGTEFGKEMWTLVSKKLETTFTEPVDPGTDATKGQLEKYKMQLQEVMRDEKRYKKEKAKVFRIVMGQCLSAMRNKLEGLPEYATLEENDDVIGLLGKLSELVYSTEHVQYEYWTMQSTMRKVMNLGQEPKESLVSFSRRFLAQVEATEGIWGKLIPMKMKGKLTTEQDAARHQFLACVFLAGVDRQYKTVVDDLNNDFLSGTTNYPKDVPGMLKLLTNRRGSGGGTSKREDALKDGVNATSFAQQGQRNRIKCFRCGQRGHVVKECPNKTYTRNEDDLSKEIAADASEQRKFEKDFVSWSG